LETPIQNRIGMVFVPVSDVVAAGAWYGRILGQPPQETAHEGNIYAMPMAGEVGLILDSHRPVANSAQPLCFFWTSDIGAADTFLRELGVEIVRPIEDIGGLFTLTFKDPDGNLLMFAQSKAA
jgi:predicted enzyme related to lactoylglutathione lyase